MGRAVNLKGSGRLSTMTENNLLNSVRGYNPKREELLGRAEQLTTFQKVVVLVRLLKILFFARKGDEK